MSRPKRIQLRRTKGWRKPDGCVVVARPSKWGNPFPVKGDWVMWTAVALGYHGGPAGRREVAVKLYRAWLLGETVPLGPGAAPSGGDLEYGDGSTMAFSDRARGIAMFGAAVSEQPVVGVPPHLADDLPELRGKDLACWCPLDQPCHADVLLELANS